MSLAQRPAFYALSRGGWRDYVTLLHPPYTLWHLSYVAIGASLAPELEANRLLWGLAAFLLGLGVGAHALDELHGRPLQTRIPRPVLAALAALSLAAAVAIGIGAALAWTLWLLPFVALGAFPVLAAYLGAAETLRPEALLAAAFALLTSLAQRSLSTQVRTVRRRVTQVTGIVRYRDGTQEPVDAAMLTRAPEKALRALSAAMVVLAVTLVWLRLA